MTLIAGVHGINVVSLTGNSRKKMKQNMRKLFTIALLFFTFALQAQNLKTYFIALPDSLSPLLTTVNRQDFGDFLESGMKAEVQNRFGNTSEMKKLTENYLMIQLTSVSQMEMKLLPVNDSTKVICVAKTYKGPVADTQLAFYSTDWKELPVEDFIQLPEKEKFYIQPSLPEKRDSLENLKGKADMYLLKANLSEKDNSLSLIYTVADYLDKETADAIRPYLCKEPLRYQWQAGRFVVEN